MSLLINDDDVRKISAATSQVIKDAIGQTATVLVPAIESAASGMLSNVKITIGPITIQPIEIVIGVSE